MTVSSERITWHMLSGYRTVTKGSLDHVLKEARKVAHMPYRIVATYGSTYHKNERNLYTKFDSLHDFIEAYRYNT